MEPRDEESQAETSRADNKKKAPNYPGPKPGLKYPMNVFYCRECSLPAELCEYSPNPDACNEWLNKNHPDFFNQINNLKISESGDAATAAGGEESADKKSTHQKRGGKGMPKSKKEKQPSKVVLSKDKRKGNKYVTIIQGLAANDIDIEVAKKFFANKFSCGCSKGEHDELIIQGDFVDTLFTVIPEKFPQIAEEMIEEKEK